MSYNLEFLFKYSHVKEYLRLWGDRLAARPAVEMEGVLQADR